MNLNLRSVLFQTPDGKTWLASYNISGSIVCNDIGSGIIYKFDDLFNVFPELMERIKRELDDESFLGKHLGDYCSSGFKPYE